MKPHTHSRTALPPYWERNDSFSNLSSPRGKCQEAKVSMNDHYTIQQTSDQKPSAGPFFEYLAKA